MDKKPRIAFCFSWQARTLDQTYLFFQKNLFDAAKEQWFDYDVFCAVEDDEDVDKVKLLNPTKVEKIKSSDVEKIIEEKYWDFIDNEMYKYWYFIVTWEYSLIQQTYKIQRSIQMIGNEEYDLIFRLRFDTIFLNKLNFNKIYAKIKNWWVLCNNEQTNNNTIISYFAHSLISYLEISDLFFVWWKDMEIFWHAFDEFKTVIIKHKTYEVLNPIYKMIHKLKDLSRNSKIVPITVVNIFARFFWLQVLVGDSYFLRLLYNMQIYKTDISMILLRKKIEKSGILLRRKTEFEH